MRGDLVFLSYVSEIGSGPWWSCPFKDVCKRVGDPREVIPFNPQNERLWKPKRRERKRGAVPSRDMQVGSMVILPRLSPGLLCLAGGWDSKLIV